MSGIKMAQTQEQKIPSLSIIIPVYNGSKTIAVLVERLLAIEIPGGKEIVLINDGSQDNSAEICQGIVSNTDKAITFLDLTRNFGEHNAVLTGMRQASGHWVITMDDDLQNAPEDVPKLFNYARDNDLDVAYTHFSNKQHTFFRNLGSRFANFTANLLLNKPKRLYLSSFRCIRRIIVDNISSYVGPYPYIDGLIFQVTDRVGSIQVRHQRRSHGRSNYTILQLIKLWLNIFLNFSTLPLRISLWFGFGLALLSIIGIAYVFIDYFYLDRIAPGWASLMSVLLAFAGMQFIFLGIVGEYLGRLYLTTNNRPQSIVRSLTISKAVNDTRSSKNRE